MALPRSIDPSEVPESISDSAPQMPMPESHGLGSADLGSPSLESPDVGSLDLESLDLESPDLESADLESADLESMADLMAHEITPPMIHLSSQAVEKVREMLEEEDLLDEGGLRLSSLPGAGCSAPLQFGMELDVAPEPGDIVLEGQGIRIFMDPTSAWSLDGLKVDYVTNPHMGEGFAFQHPRGPSGRSC